MSETITGAPARNVPRGTLLALVAAPIGVVVYVAIYQFGFIASIIGFGVAWLAMTLYRVGSGAQLDRTGAIRVTIITIATIVVAIFGGIVWDLAQAWGEHFSVAAASSFFDDDFWRFVRLNLTDADVLGSYGPDILIALAFGALGCFSTLRRAFVRTAPVATAPAPSDALAHQPTDDGTSGQRD